ncbi:MAG TPA: hypothetical protein VM118_03210 [Acidobacteriota bacterium]|nr:hypothetical protein [Acidobacteriota bacterium]
MKKYSARIVLAALGVLMLSGGAVRQEPDDVGQAMTAAERQVWLDSLIRQWPAGIIPISSLHREESSEDTRPLHASVSGSSSLDCPPMLEIQLTYNRAGYHLDEERAVTELFAFEVSTFQVRKHEVDTALGVTSFLIPVDSGGVWLAEDLDEDGELELVLQYADQMKIYSAPDWRLRSRFVFPGMAVEMRPVAVNIDDDPYLEIYVTPNTPGEEGFPTVIKYDEPSDSFKIIFQMWAPNGAIGWPAVGDFDQDGRTEFISGNNLRGGYELFEWRDSVLAYIGSVGSTLDASTRGASAGRPKPGGLLHALLGYSGGAYGFRYELFEPTGDNTFASVHVFQEFTGWVGLHLSLAADTDCDGLDELAMLFYPYYRIWEWDEIQSAFVEDCSWDEESVGSLSQWLRPDFDQNGAPEWGILSNHGVLRSFPDPDCVGCDSTGDCTPPILCHCKCVSDPQCDGQTNVLDVVHAVNVAFRGGMPEPDPFPQCPDVETTDVDCTGATDVLDVVRIVNVAFRGGNPAVEFCDPCE